MSELTKVQQLKIENFDLICAQDALNQQQQKVKQMLDDKLKLLNDAMEEERKAQETTSSQDAPK